MQESLELTASEIVNGIARLATLPVGTPQDQINALFVETHQNLFAKNADGKNIITSTSLEPLARGRVFANRIGQILDAQAGTKFPGTNTQFFERGVSLGLVTFQGQLIDFFREPVGLGYEYASGEEPFVLSKPHILNFLRISGREMSIAKQENADLLKALLGKTIHLGGRVVYLPVDPGEANRMMLMGISHAGLTPDAIKLMVNYYVDAGARHSIDPEDPKNTGGIEGFFTAAGYWDKTEGEIVQAVFDGKSKEEIQEIINRRWRILQVLGNPGPLPPQNH